MREADQHVKREARADGCQLGHDDVLVPGQEDQHVNGRGGVPGDGTQHVVAGGVAVVALGDDLADRVLIRRTGGYMSERPPAARGVVAEAAAFLEQGGERVLKVRDLLSERQVSYVDFSPP